MSNMNNMRIIIYREMNECRESSAAAVVNGEIFCSGGRNDNILNSVECYDPSSDVWTQISNIPYATSGHGAIEMNGNLIVIGAIDGGIRWKNVWALDTTDKNAKWIKKPPMSRTRMWFSIAKIEDKIFVCGGTGADAGYNVRIFDGEVWRNGPNMPISRHWTPAVVIPMEFARYLS